MKCNTINQLPIPPKYRIVGDTTKLNSLQDAAERLYNLTINKDYYIYTRNVPKSVKSNYAKLSQLLRETGEITRPTLFKEIEAVTGDIDTNVIEILNKRLNKEPISVKKYGKLVLQSIMDHIENIWDDSMLYVMSHSSGYDSRLISGIIKKLGKKNVCFMCFQPEIDQFKKIMLYEGWSSDHIVTIGEDIEFIDYYSAATRFTEVGKYASDASKFITYCFRYVLEKEIEKLNTNVRIISGLHSDELLVSGRSSPAYFTVRMLHDIFFEWGKYDPVLPFLSVDFMNHYINYDIKTSTNDIKKTMIDLLDPGLFDLEN